MRGGWAAEGPPAALAGSGCAQASETGQEDVEERVNDHVLGHVHHAAGMAKEDGEQVRDKGVHVRPNQYHM